MRHLAFTLVLTTGLSALPAAAQEDSAAATAERLGDRVVARAVDSDGSVGFGQSTAVVQAPIDDVMAVVLDYGSYSEFMPHFTQSRVLSERGTSAMVYMQASAFHDTITLWANMRLRKRPDRGATQVVEGTMSSGNLETFTAIWEVTPIDDDRTLVQFRLLIEPDMPFPSGVMTDENVRNARRVLTAFRSRVRRS
jgi:ribosome-associated toxin RatA of RatAB toxin-antitoxin module